MSTFCSHLRSAAAAFLFLIAALSALPCSSSADDAMPSSPAWLSRIPEARDAGQIFVVAGVGKTTATVSMHTRDAQGKWRQVFSTPGFIGINGLGKTREGDGKTPAGTFRFNAAFGLGEDPGCAIPYTQADGNLWWSGDTRRGMHYNQLVDIREFPDLSRKDSERIADYPVHYRYCLNISYNEKCVPGAGSAIFLHCFGPVNPYTGGCVAIPEDKMILAMQNVEPGCVVVIGERKAITGK
ncbi:MAG: L,D-transpeptidase family protein [Mailhella sp.]|nr:L,D-transpeptidase family protein [Mailhella sp.]